jgi:hypothetical protein
LLLGKPHERQIEAQRPTEKAHPSRKHREGAVECGAGEGQARGRRGAGEGQAARMAVANSAQRTVQTKGGKGAPAVTRGLHRVHNASC